MTVSTQKTSAVANSAVRFSHDYLDIYAREEFRDLVLNANVHGLQALLGFVFHDERLLLEVTIHPSVLPDHDIRAGEGRLFLRTYGEEVIRAAVRNTMRFRTSFPVTVSRSCIAQMAESIGLDGFLLLGDLFEEVTKNSPVWENVLARALGALVGAIYLDQGWPAAFDFAFHLARYQLGESMSESVPSRAVVKRTINADFIDWDRLV